ncbi:hypothetical protein DU478_18920 [Thalassococcus profundi]|uniref:PRC-barrel domain containing protein n=1 Tax=Thalassococcus profundi TaxID=2282382 RepID=A0A369TIJ5_9RHOB|nr:hypothetical protein [Thalassococcus profundi]RDD64642.1 hypothetical protein DU478_18920 [Thalassococcus profundi]
MDLMEIFRWTASIATILASVCVAWGRPARLVAVGFILFTLASISWVIVGMNQDKSALLAQNAFLLCVNVWGLLRWWSRDD